MKKMRKVALRENKMQIATGQRENPETVAVSGFFVLHDQFRYTLKMSDFKGWSGFSPFRPLFFCPLCPTSADQSMF